MMMSAASSGGGGVVGSQDQYDVAVQVPLYVAARPPVTTQNDDGRDAWKGRVNAQCCQRRPRRGRGGL